MTPAEKAQEAAREIRLATNHLSRCLSLLDETAEIGSVSPATLTEVVKSIATAQGHLGLAGGSVAQAMQRAFRGGRGLDALLPPAGGVMR